MSIKGLGISGVGGGGGGRGGLGWRGRIREAWNDKKRVE